MHEKDTAELFEELKIHNDVEIFLAENQNEMSQPLCRYLNKILQEKNLSKKAIIEKLNFDKKYAYHIFSGAKKPSREKILAIARAMNLNLNETQYLLRYGGYGILYPRDSWDAVIIYAIEHDLTVAETDYYLHQLGEIPIGSSNEN